MKSKIYSYRQYCNNLTATDHGGVELPFVDRGIFGSMDVPPPMRQAHETENQKQEFEYVFNNAERLLTNLARRLHGSDCNVVVRTDNNCLITKYVVVEKSDATYELRIA